MSVLSDGLPLVAAPMAGGPSTPALVGAADAVDATGFLAAGYLTVAALAEQVADVRAGGTDRFGVNLFVPDRDEQGLLRPPDPGAYARYRAALDAEAAARGVVLPSEPVVDDDAWAAKLDLLRGDPVPVVSFTFGLPTPEEVTSLQRASSEIWATVTTPHEARAAAEVGADVLVVQGPRAGGHSATFDPQRPLCDQPTSALVAAVRAVTSLPIVAAGGVAAPSDITGLVHAGASAVAVGTLLLRTDEAGTNPVHRAALVDPRYDETVMTSAFTGRPARALRNAFTDRHGDEAPIAYPAVHHLTRGLRQAAVAAQEPDGVHLWAGAGFRAAGSGPAGTVLTALAAGL